MKKFTKNTSLMAALVISAVALGNAGSTLYLPAMIKIGADLHTTNGLMKLTLSFYLLACGLSQLFYGPLSDAFGRRINLLVGLFIFVLGSVISAFSASIWMLLGGRLIEGIGIGTANAVGYALLRDIFTGHKLTRQLSYVSVFVGMSPIISPLFGGYLVEYLGWRFCFIALVLLSLTLAILKFFLLPETNKELNPTAHHPHVALKNYFFLCKSAIYMRSVATASIAFASLLALNGMLPFIVIDTLHVAPSTYGWLTICTGLGYLSGAFLAGKIAHSTKPDRIILAGIAINMGFTVLGFFLTREYFHLITLIPSLVFILCGVGIIVPVASSGAMEPFPKLAGSEAALLGALMFCTASIFVAISSCLSSSAYSMFLFLFFLTLLLLAAFASIRSKKKL